MIVGSISLRNNDNLYIAFNFMFYNMYNKVIGKNVIYLQEEYSEEYFGKCSVAL